MANKRTSTERSFFFFFSFFFSPLGPPSYLVFPSLPIRHQSIIYPRDLLPLDFVIVVCRYHPPVILRPAISPQIIGAKE
jgi:hypothetical protein